MGTCDGHMQWDGWDVIFYEATLGCGHDWNIIYYITSSSHNIIWYLYYIMDDVAPYHHHVIRWWIIVLSHSSLIWAWMIDSYIIMSLSFMLMRSHVIVFKWVGTVQQADDEPTPNIIVSEDENTMFIIIWYYYMLYCIFPSYVYTRFVLDCHFQSSSSWSTITPWRS